MTRQRTERRRRNELGPVGADVAAAAANLRRSRSMTLRAVADRMTRAGRRITTSGIQRIETGERRVDADDLVALAAALGVAPARLLGEHAGPVDSDGSTGTGELAVWNPQLRPILDAVDQVVDEWPAIDDALILDAVAFHLDERHTHDADAMTAADQLGLAIGLAQEAGERTVAGLRRYLALVRDAVRDGAITGEQVRDRIRESSTSSTTTEPAAG